MNRKLVMAVVVSAALSGLAGGAFAGGGADGVYPEGTRAEPELVATGGADGVYPEGTRAEPELVADGGDEKKDEKPELVAEGDDPFPKGSSPELTA